MLRYKEIKIALVEMVSTMKPGDKLPSRLELCKKLETTRTTLDKAIMELCADRVLSSEKGSATRVVGFIEGTDKEADNWCVIVPDATEGIYNSLLRGIEEIAQQHGTNTIICSSHNDGDKQEQYIKRLMVSGITGFAIVPIVADNPMESYRLYENLIRSKVPFVFCNRGVEGIDAPIVKSNDFYGGYIATKHLISMGYRKIAYICELKYSTSIERYEGYIGALMEEKLPVRPQYILIPPHGVMQDCMDAAKSLLQQADAPDAFFCFNDRIAFAVMRAVNALNMQVSDDVGVIGYDDTFSCTESSPQLTSISYQSKEIGKTAARVLVNARSTGTEPYMPEYQVFQPELAIRRSCRGPVRRDQK